MSWEEPAWMAQARLDLEEYQLRTLACLREGGFDGMIALGGLVSIHIPVDEHGNEAPGQLDLGMSVAARCHDAVPQPPLWESPQDEAAFERMLEVRDCLLAHGFDPGEPPSLDVWIDEFVPWNPRAELSAFADYEIALDALCPQSGHGLFFHFVD